MKLCCFLNYAPHYRESIFKKIDETFDTQFYFGEDPRGKSNSGIKKLDYSIFKKRPIEFKNKLLFKRYLWRTKLMGLAFRNYDTFLVTGDYCWGYIPFGLLCRVLGKKVYGWGHGPKTQKGIRGKIISWPLRVFTGYFTYGEGGKRRMTELGYKEDNIKVIYNSLTDVVAPNDYTKLASDLYSSHFKNTRSTVLFIGRLTKVKQLDWIIKAQHDLALSGCNFNTVFIGDGPMKDNLLELTEQLGLTDQVWFYGACYNQSILNELIYNADLCVSPGNVGLTALHAAQYGLPILSHDDFETQMPEYEIIVPNKTGLLYKSGDFEDFKESISRWLSSHSNDREQIRQNCYAAINTHFNSNYQLDVLKQTLL